MNGKSAQAHMEDFFYAEMIQYLKLAEERRRWNLFKDIPWEEVNFNTTNTLAEMVETFSAVEMYLPDFTSKMLHMIRRSRGRAWFHVNWGYEESKHALSLETWLLASAHRTEVQRKTFEQSLLGQEWELPFDHPRQMVCYTMIQELATFWNYRQTEKIAIQERDPALIGALRLISVDERVHYNFYKNAVKEWMRYDEAGTVADLKYVFDNFTMPGHAQIPGYDKRAATLAKTRVYGPREYIRLVKNPVLGELGLSKDFEIMEREEQSLTEEKYAEAVRLQRDRVVLAGPAEPRVPLLEAIGMKKDQISRLNEMAEHRADSTYDMPGLSAFDRRLMATGDEHSNNSEELRAERSKRRKNRMKNDRLRRGSEEEKTTPAEA